MRFKDLKLGQLFEIYNDDNEEATTTRGRITAIAKAGTIEDIIAVQFDDDLGTYMWGMLEEGTTARGLTLLEDAE